MSEHNERWTLNHLIDTCLDGERGERAALAAYEDGLNSVLAPATREVIERQCATVRDSHGLVHALVQL
jgi:hypothetical protein